MKRCNVAAVFLSVYAVQWLSPPLVRWLVLFMKPILVGLLQLLICFLASGVFAQTASDAGPCDSESGTVSPRRHVGLFVVHQRCGRVLYEIPPTLLDRPMLISTEFRALRERKYDAQTAGRFADAQMVRWVRRGDQVDLERITFEKRAERERDSMHPDGRVVRHFVMRTFDVLADGAGNAPIIDVTPLFLSDLPTGFTQEFRAGFEWIGLTRNARSLIRSRRFLRTSKSHSRRLGTPIPLILPSSQDPRRTPCRLACDSCFRQACSCCPNSRCTAVTPTIGWATFPFPSTSTEPAAPVPSSEPSSSATGWRRKTRTLQFQSRSSRSFSMLVARYLIVGGPTSSKASRIGRARSKEQASETPLSPGTHLLCKRMGSGIPMMRATQSCAGVPDRMGWAGGWLIRAAARSSFLVRYSGIACLITSRPCTSPRQPPWMRARSACLFRIR